MSLFPKKKGEHLVLVRNFVSDFLGTKPVVIFSNVIYIACLVVIILLLICSMNFF